MTSSTTPSSFLRVAIPSRYRSMTSTMSRRLARSITSPAAKTKPVVATDHGRHPGKFRNEIADTRHRNRAPSFAHQHDPLGAPADLAEGPEAVLVVRGDAGHQSSFRRLSERPEGRSGDPTAPVLWGDGDGHLAVSALD